MSAWFCRRRFGHNGRRAFAVRMRLEQLETRACPAAPMISSLNVAVTADNLIQVTGLIVDENPQTAVIDFTGVLSGTAQADANGAFTFTAPASGTGSFTIGVIDDESLAATAVTGQVTSAGVELAFTAATSASAVSPTQEPFADVLSVPSLALDSVLAAEANVADAGTVRDLEGEEGSPPMMLEGEEDPLQIIDFTAELGPGNVWVFTGTVQNGTPGVPICVELDGLVHEIIPVNQNGVFVYSAELPAGTSGFVTAQAFDENGRESAIVTVYINPPQ